MAVRGCRACTHSCKDLLGATSGGRIYGRPERSNTEVNGTERGRAWNGRQDIDQIWIFSKRKIRRNGGGVGHLEALLGLNDTVGSCDGTFVDDSDPLSRPFHS